MATPEQVAHTLRRTGFGIWPGQVDSLIDDDIHDLIDARIADEGWALSPEETNSRDFEEIRYDTLPREWMDRIISPEAGLHERMVWMWHNHFTTNRGETNHQMMWRQHQTIRRHALGNVRDLARAILEDGAMLHFLDGDGSRGEAPNENLSREFLELFMLGRNAGYTEGDIRAGARILSGWRVNYETSDVEFDRERAYTRPVEFLGQRKNWNLDSYLDAVMSQPACAGHLAEVVHTYLVSTPLSNERRDELGQVLRTNDWELRPLISEILHHDDFVNGLGVRTREPVEWLGAAAAAFDLSAVGEDGFTYWQIGQTGQVPFEPPNAGGWVNDERWSSASQILVRGNALLHWEVSEQLINSVAPTPSAVLAHCGILSASDTTIAAMERAIDVQTEYDRGLELLLTMALLSPEFSTI